MVTFILVPGMCHGGWCFAELAEQLRRRGHRAYPLTLTGLSERSHLLHGGVNLDTHIQDVTGVLDAENIEDAVLVGHSYGGMVTTGVADRMPERVRALVYLDAVVPQHDDSCWNLVTDQERRWYADVVESGYAVRPLPFFDARATPHPIASLLQPLRLTADPARIRHRVYVYAAGWDGPSPFTPTYQRLRDDPAWTTHAVDGGHNLMRDAPHELLNILLQTGESADRRRAGAGRPASTA
ncbi:alpha/beta fold hydrolase [Micromonospora humi]|uniref:Pimeloyl-ACP methyl ester carboxylesterase n=1 Tax=Micromonospora humi TaxID=745366 RepID=A0A1C5H6E8_9ACTN|nr:alpha/beta fold hydrolase [Micromonospora humi]SCG41560.1 Pimeloyl-ACP methyl ester carboxylesterase [Micromonospora humi]